MNENRQPFGPGSCPRGARLGRWVEHASCGLSRGAMRPAASGIPSAGTAAPARAPHAVPRPHAARQRGVAAILAMMFLVIFGALATAMAIVAQGNLATADSSLKINRSLAAAETGLRLMLYEANQAAASVKTRTGLIDGNNAPALWAQVETALDQSLSGNLDNLAEPYETGSALHVGPIALGPGAPTFTATFTPHPIAGENYGSAYYQRPPYSTMTPAVSASNPLNASWIRLSVTGTDSGGGSNPITRTINLDIHLQKLIPFAILSRSRVMIGTNVRVDGTIGSTFMEDNLANGHPVQMASDFMGLDPTLDAELTAFRNTLAVNDMDGDNRLNLANPAEVAGITNPAQYDTDHDGYITDFDFFMAFYDKTDKGYLTPGDLNTAGNPRMAQLFQLLDTAGDPNRPGYNDGIIDANDMYAKVSGQVLIEASKQSWQSGAANGQYQDYFQGPIVAPAGKPPLTFDAPDMSNYQFSPSDFDTSSLKALATGDFNTEVAAQLQQYDPNNSSSPQPVTYVMEPVPYGSPHPYDYYKRPVYKNMTFTNVTIPQGTNALFENCKFIGCTYVQTSTDNGYVDPATNIDDYNYAGAQQADGSLAYPGVTTVVNGQTVSDTKPLSNNLRFDNCDFEGAVAGDVPNQFTLMRNKLAFTGNTQFNIADSQNLTDAEKQLYARSTIMMPQYSVDMGSYTDPNAPQINLSGTIVAGIIDLRGQIVVDGQIVTTFQPQSNTAVVQGYTSPQYNVTLGYFSSAQGDLEEEIPTSGGLGRIYVKYDPSMGLPDGILGPVSLTPDWQTYFETAGD